MGKSLCHRGMHRDQGDMETWCHFQSPLIAEHNSWIPEKPASVKTYADCRFQGIIITGKTIFPSLLQKCSSQINSPLGIPGWNLHVSLSGEGPGAFHTNSNHGCFAKGFSSCFTTGQTQTQLQVSSAGYPAPTQKHWGPKAGLSWAASGVGNQMISTSRGWAEETALWNCFYRHCSSKLMS